MQAPWHPVRRHAHRVPRDAPRSSIRHHPCRFAEGPSCSSNSLASGWSARYTILAGTIELLDARGKRLAFHENDGSGKAYDYDWKLPAAVVGVRTIRFNALGDQGKENPHDDIAIGEFQVE
jgi:hypothetical protein